MRPLPLAFFLLCLLQPCIYAAPTSQDSSSPALSSETDSFQSSTPAPSQLAPTSHASSTATATAPRKPTSVDNKPQHKGGPPTTPPKPSEQITARPGSADPTSSAAFTNPTHAHGHDPPMQHGGHRQSIAELIFEIIAVLIGVAALVSFVRCFYIYKRTPARDRIAAIVHRHQLQREMEELERNPPDNRPSLEPPPPPYLRPPSYENEYTPLSHAQHSSVPYAAHNPVGSPRPNG